MNIEFAKQVLTSTDEYWLVSREIPNYRDDLKSTYHTWLISIPYSDKYRRGIDIKDLLVLEIEAFLSADIVGNIPISDNCPPFQIGITFHDIKEGIPIKDKTREVLKMLLCMDYSDFYTYKKAVIDFQAVNGI